MPQLVASIEGVEIKTINLRKDYTSLGRRNDNDIVLENMAVSGRHCVFELRDMTNAVVEDLNSTNGTFVNGDKVRRHELKQGDVVAVAGFRLRYLADENAPPTFSETATQKFEVSAFQDAAPVSAHPAFHVLNGSSAGLEVPVVKAVTTFGKPGVALISVSRRRTGYYVACMDATVQPMLNGEPIKTDGSQLIDGDIIELGGTRMKFQQQTG